MNLKMFNGDNLSHKLLLITRQKQLNAFNNNIAQISKINQSGRYLGSLLNKLADPFMKVAVLLTKNILAPSGIRAAAIEAEIRWLQLSFVLCSGNSNFNNFKQRNE